MTCTVLQGGAQSHGSVVEVRDGRVLVDGKDVTPAAGVVAQISGDVNSVIASGGACIVINGKVDSVMNSKGAVGTVVIGNAAFGNACSKMDVTPSKDATSNGLDAGDQLTQPPVEHSVGAMGWISLAFFVLGIAVAFVEWLIGEHGFSLVLFCVAWWSKHGEAVALRTSFKTRDGLNGRHKNKDSSA